MKESNETYECRDEEGVINTLRLEEWQLDLDNEFAILSTDFIH